MANNITVTEGTAKAVKTREIASEHVQAVYLNVGTASDNPFNGTVLEVSKLATGTVSVNTPGTITSGTVSVNTPGTITSGSIAITDGTVKVTTPGTITSGSIAVTTGTIVGNIASGTTDSGNPVKVGGKYNLSAPTFTDGYRADLQQDINGLLKIREGYGPGYEDNVNGVAAILQKPISNSSYAPSDYTNFGAVPGTNVKGSAGNVYSVHVTSTSSTISYFQLFNASSAVPNGATPVASYVMGSVTSGGVAELKLDTTHFAPSKYFSTGISWAISSTNGTLGTASITASNHNVHIKYV